MAIGLSRLATGVLGVIIGAFAAGAALAQDETCKNRGQFDTLYCDEDHDLVADLPRDRKN
jgi:phosphonate transport system substrate-binding protein